MWKKKDEETKIGQTEEKDPFITPIVNSNHEPHVKEKSSIGKSIVIKGDIIGHEDLFVQGRIEGTLCLKNNVLNIGRHGNLTANVYAKNVNIEGEIKGDVYACENILVKKSGHVHGNMVARSVMVDSGAQIKGNIDMDEKTIEKYFPQENLGKDQETITIAATIHTPAEKNKLDTKLLANANASIDRKSKGNKNLNAQTKSEAIKPAD